MNNMISMNLKYLREKHSLTQAQFAEKLSVSRQTVAKWENGESLPDLKSCSALALLFDVSIDALITYPLDEKEEMEAIEADGKYVFGIVKVGERGQVVIPKQARNVYDIKAGDKLLALGDEKGMAFAKMKNIPEFHFGK